MPAVSKKIKVVEPNKPFRFFIENSHVRAAKCKDPSQCVIAQAIRDAYPDDDIGIEVGSSITKIRTDTKLIRYGTPAKLKNKLAHFDKTSLWDLPAGVYHLLPLSKDKRLGNQKSRWGLAPAKVHGKNTKKSKRSVFKGRALPTRKISKTNG